MAHDTIHRSTDRTLGVDALRGLIIALMALDHARSAIARNHPSEFWGVPLPVYPDALSFLTRLVTHLCAPGFFLLMGFSMVMMHAARTARGWEEAKVRRHLIVRGMVLMVVQHLLVNPGFLAMGSGADVPTDHYGVDWVPGSNGQILLYFGVLQSLGWSMLLGAFCLRLPAVVLVAMGVGVWISSQGMLPPPTEVETVFAIPWRLLLIAGQTGAVHVRYPILPWFGVALFGMGLAKVWLDARDKGLRMAVVLGVVLLGAFLVVREIGGPGNTHPPQPGWIGFLNVTKYPPSIAFLCVTTGTNLLLLAALERFGSRLGGLWTMLCTFGGASLFFYVVHLYLYGAMGWAFPRGVILPWLYPVWGVGLLLLVPACRRYSRFKATRPTESLWRLF